MKRSELIGLIRQKRTCLCIGLDSDIEKIPKFLLKYEDPVFEFNNLIVEATSHLCVAYKPNIAFYEAMGAKGWGTLKKTMDVMPEDVFTIADAKRGDIGNTSHLYARAFFDKKYSGFDFDAVTVAPYMGSDSVKPFLSYPDKWAIILALTSNDGSGDFQRQRMHSGKPLYREVLEKSSSWAGADKIMYVVGATRAEQFEDIRAVVPDHFLLVPGVGAQGGNLELILKKGTNTSGGLLVNASRSIIYASLGEDFAEKAREEASSMNNMMEKFIGAES
jgi:orotidine-5'-phosphate decarboxylase